MKKGFSLVVSILLFILLLTGCGGNTTDSSAITFKDTGWTYTVNSGKATFSTVLQSSDKDNYYLLGEDSRFILVNGESELSFDTNRPFESSTGYVYHCSGYGLKLEKDNIEKYGIQIKKPEADFYDYSSLNATSCIVKADVTSSSESPIILFYRMRSSSDNEWDVPHYNFVTDGQGTIVTSMDINYLDRPEFEIECLGASIIPTDGDYSKFLISDDVQADRSDIYVRAYGSILGLDYVSVREITGISGEYGVALVSVKGSSGASVIGADMINGEGAFISGFDGEKYYSSCEVIGFLSFTSAFDYQYEVTGNEEKAN